MAIPVNIAFLHLVGRRQPGEQAAEVFEIDLQVVGMGDILEGELEQLRFGIADECADRAIDLQPAAIQIDQRDADGGELKRAGEAFLTRPERFLRPLLFRDILHRALHANDPARRIAFGLADGTEPDAAALGGDDFAFDIVGSAFACTGFEGLAEPLPVFRQAKPQSLFKRHGCTGREIVKETLFLRKGDAAFGQIDGPTPELRDIAGHAEERFTFMQAFLGPDAVGQVGHPADHPDRFSLVVADDVAAIQHVGIVAAFAHEPVFG